MGGSFSGRWAVGRLALPCALVVLGSACNAILGTPEPELAVDGAADSSDAEPPNGDAPEAVRDAATQDVNVDARDESASRDQAAGEPHDVEAGESTRDSGAHDSAAADVAAEDSIVQDRAEDAPAEDSTRDDVTQDSASQDSAPSDSAVQDSTVLDSTAQDSTVQDSTAVEDSTVQDSTVQDSTVQDSTVAQDATLQDSTVRDSTIQDSGAGTDAGATLPPSCQNPGPGVTSCGTAGDSCCTSFVVGGGMFWRNFTLQPDGAVTGLGYTASVSSFRLDEYEVTVGRFRQFVAAANAGWTPPPGSGIHSHVNTGLGLGEVVDGGTLYEPGWLAAWDANMSQPNNSGLGSWNTNLSSCGSVATWTPAPGAQENLPINCINWYESYAFCIWDDGFLPSEAEWAYAASGGSEQRAYPWGADPGLVNQYAVYDCEYPDGGWDAAATCNLPGHIAPVGSLPMGVGRWGQLDLGGNVSENLFDFWAPYVIPCNDCTYLMPTIGRSTRGGAWNFNAVPLINSSRYEWVPIDRFPQHGIRCARVP